ncbi:MAG: hypothetical protein WD738_24015 [Pirellulales bacterium]
MSSFHYSFIILRELGLDFVEMIIGVCQSIVNVRGLQVRILLDDFFDPHPLPVAVQDRCDTNSRSGDHGLTAAACWVLFDIAII